jgi:uncharacterized protein YdeI (YjbR/CyaY-like superfamily)
MGRPVLHHKRKKRVDVVRPKRQGSGFIMEEAVKLEVSGAKIEFQDQRNASYPPFLTDYFASNPELAEAFARLTPGRQRSYLMHFLSAKQAATQLRRIQQCTPKILMGKGLQEY